MDILEFIAETLARDFYSRDLTEVESVFLYHYVIATIKAGAA